MSLFNQLFAKKSLEQLQKEAAGDGRLHRVLGPVALTSLGVGAIIGAGIFVMTGQVAANDAGPSIMLSFVVAGIACALAAFCYSEFASMAPVAGSAYTYAYATLGELLAWIIGWDLILEYAMSCATVAASWTKYLNAFLEVCFNWRIPDQYCQDPISHPGAYGNLPAVGILLIVTVILVIGIRESAMSNTILVCVKLTVVLFVIAVGAFAVSQTEENWWTDVPASERKLPEEIVMLDAAKKHAEREAALQKASEDWSSAVGKQKREVDNIQTTSHVRDENGNATDKKDLKYLVPPQANTDERTKLLTEEGKALLNKRENRKEDARFRRKLEMPKNEQDQLAAEAVLKDAEKEAKEREVRDWGLLAKLGINDSLKQIDDGTRSNFIPYGLSGIMLGAAIVFFAFIGFDSISTHSEEAIKPQRDVPIGILASLFLCTLLYIAVAGIITRMEAYPAIDTDAAVATAFSRRADAPDEKHPDLMRASAGLIAAGALAGMTSVLLITFLSQARVFLAMSRDGLLPHAIFGAVHERFRTPHISTMLTGGLICLVAAFTPITVLGEMVNIGTLFAFTVVCAAVLILRIQRPDAPRPFRCPAVFFVAPAGIAVNLLLMLFLPVETWLRLFGWLAIGLVIYFFYGRRFSKLNAMNTGTSPVSGPA